MLFPEVFVLAVLCLIVTLGLPQTPPQGPPAQAPLLPTGQTPAAPKTPAKQAPYEFVTDVGAFIIVVKAAKASEFDAAMSRLRTAMMQSKDVARVQQASTWRLLKSAEAPVEGNVTYIWMIDPVAKKATYDPILILRELKPADVQTVFDQLSGAIVSMTRIGLKEIKI